MARDEPHDGEGRSPGRAVAVFGGSDSLPGSPEYRDAYEVGRLLAIAGIAVVNGGYGGVMEASARGAREAGGHSIGVTTRAFRARPSANPFIETEHSEDDLFLRTRRLIETARAFIILPGKAGTLAELSFLWALQKADLLGPKPILVLGKVWEDLLRVLRTANLLEEEAAAATRVAGSPQEAVEAVTLSLQGSR
ncbi:MAG: DNA-binding protein [Acidobacteria bacterium]|nr:MAG: DNA-binding protein [Acidobacteriota bacterium]